MSWDADELGVTNTYKYSVTNSKAEAAEGLALAINWERSLIAGLRKWMRDDGWVGSGDPRS